VGEIGVVKPLDEPRSYDFVAIPRRNKNGINRSNEIPGRKTILGNNRTFP
jgi:hypothetical protein